MKAGEHITAAKDKKIEQLLASMEGLRIDLATKTQQNQEKEEELNQMTNKYNQLEEEHSKGNPSAPISSSLTPLQKKKILST
jgi:uncharacterized membrane protein